MNKLKNLSLAVLLGLSLSVNAKGGFTDNTANVSASSLQTVSNLQTMGDDTKVVLEGYITGKAGTADPEEYFFQDSTGSLKVDIDNEVWRGQTVNPKTKVRIYGEVDYNKKAKTREVEVERLEIVQ